MDRRTEAVGPVSSKRARVLQLWPLSVPREHLIFKKPVKKGSWTAKALPSKEEFVIERHNSNASG